MFITNMLISQNNNYAIKKKVCIFAVSWQKATL